MDINIFASGSSGNLYKISDGVTSLLLECGLSIIQIKQHLRFRLSEIDGCLLTHEHMDHAKAAKDIVKSGIDLYLTSGTMEVLGIDSHRAYVVQAGMQFEVGTFIILPIEAQHDAAEPVAYLIQSKYTGEKLLFATDTYYLKYRFSGLTHIMIECNYSLDILKQNVESGLIPSALKSRIMKSHFSLDNVKTLLESNDLSKVRQIYLIHISGDNGNPERFKREVQELVGCEVITFENK